MNKQELENELKAMDTYSDEFKYRLLSRMQGDCEYFLGNGRRYEPHLWAGNSDYHIVCMKKLYNSFSDDKKPEWITLGNIKEYERKMQRFLIATVCIADVEKEVIFKADLEKYPDEIQALNAYLLGKSSGKYEVIRIERPTNKQVEQLFNGKLWYGVRKIEVYNRATKQRIASFLADDAKSVSPRNTFYMKNDEVYWYDERQCYYKSFVI